MCVFSRALVMRSKYYDEKIQATLRDSVNMINKNDLLKFSSQVQAQRKRRGVLSLRPIGTIGGKMYM